MTEIHFRNYFTYFTTKIAPETEIFQWMFDTIINFTPSELNFI